MVEFYNRIENPPQPKKEFTLSIPKEHEAAVLALLAQLQAEKDQKKMPLFSGRRNTADPEEEKIYEHPDLDKLMIVYHNQTDDEKSEYTAQFENGVGFNKNDAPILTAAAETYVSQGWVTRAGLKIVSARIQKYHRQWECLRYKFSMSGRAGGVHFVLQSPVLNEIQESFSGTLVFFCFCAILNAEFFQMHII